MPINDSIKYILKLVRFHGIRAELLHALMMLLDTEIRT